jgi:hypothetical protein
MTETAAPAVAHDSPGGDIVAKHSRSYRVKWLVMGFVLLFGAAWFMYDGFVGYEKENEKARQEAVAQGKPPPEKLHSSTDIALQKIIAFALVPLALYVLFWAMYSSRGEYRLAGGVLHVPGHPPVPIDAIRAIDQTQWDRKGIARIDYEVNGKAGRLKLDDYIYEREPTDQIHERILKAVAPEDAPATGSEV